MLVVGNVARRKSAPSTVWQSPVLEPVAEMVVDDGPIPFGGKGPNAIAENGPTSLNNSPPGDILRNFYHTKRVGNYLIGRKLGEGSFAKVREGLHALTGEKVR